MYGVLYWVLRPMRGHAVRLTARMPMELNADGLLNLCRVRKRSPGHSKTPTNPTLARSIHRRLLHLPLPGVAAVPRLVCSERTPWVPKCQYPAWGMYVGTLDRELTRGKHKTGSAQVRDQPRLVYGAEYMGAGSVRNTSPATASVGSCLVVGREKTRFLASGRRMIAAGSGRAGGTNTEHRHGRVEHGCAGCSTG
jgi:hypothetical protein